MKEFEGVLTMSVMGISIVLVVFILARYNYLVKRAIAEKGFDPTGRKRGYTFLEIGCIVLSLGIGFGICSLYTTVKLPEDTFYFLVYATLFSFGGIGLVTAHFIRRGLTGNDENSETDTIRKIVGGDTALFRNLVDAYKDRSLSLARSLIKDEEDVMDVLQDAFVRAFRNLHKFDFRSSFPTWLYRIVVNTCYTALERNRKYRERFERQGPEDRIPETSSQANGLDLTRRNERKRIINGVLDTLVPREALVLRLHYLGEQHIKEISDITGMKVSHVKVLLHRGRKNFHARLDKLVGDEKNNLYDG